MSTNKDFVKQSDEHCLVLYLNKVKSAVDNMWIKASVSMLPWPNEKEPLEALQHDMFLKLFASSTGKKVLPDHLPVVIKLSVNETAHRVPQALFIVD